MIYELHVQFYCVMLNLTNFKPCCIEQNSIGCLLLKHNFVEFFNFICQILNPFLLMKCWKFENWAHVDSLYFISNL
jgi:hypothetical protein